MKILSTHALLEVLADVGPRFARASGFTLSFSYDPTNAIRRRIDNGERFDVAIITRPVMDELTRQGRFSPDTCVDLGRSGLGVSVRKGAHKPEIDTVGDFKRALLGAASVVRSAEGASGRYFDTLLDRLGIGAVMRGKIKLGESGRVAELVAKGEAELAVQQISELLPVAGADYVGPFPAELQLYTVFAAGVAAGCRDKSAAKAFIETLTGPAMAPLFTAKGVDPVIR